MEIRDDRSFCFEPWFDLSAAGGGLEDSDKINLGGLAVDHKARSRELGRNIREPLDKATKFCDFNRGKL
jgi:hypothetical protein